MLWLAPLACALAAAALLPLQAERLRAGVGGFAVMNCHLDFPFGIEIPYHLQWDKDGETIFSWYSGEPQARVADRWGGRVRRVGGEGALGRGSINISAVRETDSGLYRCRVSFPNRTPPARNNGTFYALEVDGGNSIATPPTNVTVLEGERAELECAPRDAHAEVQWLRDDTPVARLPELAARVQRPPNGSLVLRAATSADPGHYACRVLGPGGAQTAGAYLDVQYKAKVVYAPKERHLPFGKPASLDCHFAANPPLTNLRWEKDGFLFDPYNVPGVFYSRNGSLLFNRVDESHEGEYSCTPYNALGTAGASPGVRVRVQRPPALAARPQPLYVARLGARLVLPCAAGEDAPGARVSWTRRDGSELPPGRHRLDDGNLTIADVAEEDRGVYVCTVSNEAASVAAESELMVENVPPRAPHNLTVRPEARSLHVAWVPGHNGIEVDYEVWYRERAAGEWRTMRILSRGVTEATLVGLRPDTHYELRVLAQDLIGDGLFSKPAVARTLGAEEPAAAPEPAVERAGDAEPQSGPPAGPLEVTVRLLDEGALVRWAGAPPGAECSLRWFEGAEPAPDARPLATGRTLHDYLLVSGVEEGAQYRAEVRCGPRGGSAGLQVPAWSRLRAVAAGAAASALLLALAAGALFWVVSRRRSRLRRAPPVPSARPAAPPVPHKRAR